MTEFLSTTFRALRYCVASIGCLLSTAFIAYGGLLKLDGDNDVETDIILAFGIFMAIMSCCIGVLSRTGDKQVRRLIAANNAQLNRLHETNQTLKQRVDALGTIEKDLEHNTEKFERQLQAAEERYKSRIKMLREENQRLGKNVDTLSTERRKFEEENEELTQTKEGFDLTLEAYKKQLAQVQAAHHAAREELQQLQFISEESNARVEQLERINAAQDNKIAEMAKQLDNLNELQRKSTRMIQMLAVYGDECKNMGLSLKDTAATIRKTDKSLGLTAGEMSAQVKALKSVTEALKQVAAAQGVDEDDPEDYESTVSI